MGPLSLKITIDAPRERVFDEVCDLSRRLSFTDHFISEFHLQRIEPSGRGAAARFRVGAPGRLRYMETVIDEAERPHLISERGRGGRWDRVPVRTTWELSGGEGEPTELALTFWTEPSHPFDKLRQARSGGWWKRRWRRALRRLADQIESATPEPEPVRVAGGDRRPTGLP